MLQDSISHVDACRSGAFRCEKAASTSVQFSQPCARRCLSTAIVVVTQGSTLSDRHGQGSTAQRRDHGVQIDGTVLLVEAGRIGFQNPKFCSCCPVPGMHKSRTAAQTSPAHDPAHDLLPACQQPRSATPQWRLYVSLLVCQSLTAAEDAEQGLPWVTVQDARPIERWSTACESAMAPAATVDCRGSAEHLAVHKQLLPFHGLRRTCFGSVSPYQFD